MQPSLLLPSPSHLTATLPPAPPLKRRPYHRTDSNMPSPFLTLNQLSPYAPPPPPQSSTFASHPYPQHLSNVAPEPGIMLAPLRPVEPYRPSALTLSDCSESSASTTDRRSSHTTRPPQSSLLHIIHSPLNSSPASPAPQSPPPAPVSLPAPRSSVPVNHVRTRSRASRLSPVNNASTSTDAVVPSSPNKSRTAPATARVAHNALLTRTAKRPPLKSPPKSSADLRPASTVAGNVFKPTPAKKVRSSKSNIPGESRYWTPSEHKLFVEALLKFGPKDLKSIAAHVGTRNMIQCRTHEQKCFMRLMREAQRDTLIRNGHLPDAPALDAQTHKLQKDVYSVPSSCGISLLCAVSEEMTRSLQQ